MIISPDSQAILLLCSHLGLTANAGPTPFTLREWNPLARKLRAASLNPGQLLALNAQEIAAQLAISAQEAARISALLQRGGALAIELERFESAGMRAITRADEDYPQRYRQRLGDSAPTVLFYAGNKDLLGQPGIAVVGSRNLDQIGEECAAFIGNATAFSGLVLYSGGAKGVDAISMKAALDGRGSVVGILADRLERAIRVPQARTGLLRGDLCLATPYAPSAGFSVGAAMGRNRLIYSLADYALIVASEAEQGGTWTGATEALKAGWVPVFVLDHPAMPEGNRMLLKRGGLSFPYPFAEEFSKLPVWLQTQAAQRKQKPTQMGLL